MVFAGCQVVLMDFWEVLVDFWEFCGLLSGCFVFWVF